MQPLAPPAIRLRRRRSHLHGSLRLPPGRHRQCAQPRRRGCRPSRPAGLPGRRRESLHDDRTEPGDRPHALAEARPVTSFDDEATGHLEWVTVSDRRDRLVAGACLCLVVLQALPYVAVGWITDGGTAAGDGALYALAPTSLLGVVGFGVVLAVALSRPAMEPVVRTGSAVDGPVVPRLPTWPRPPTVTTGACLPRLRWAALAALAE